MNNTQKRIEALIASEWVINKGEAMISLDGGKWALHIGNPISVVSLGESCGEHVFESESLDGCLVLAEKRLLPNNAMSHERSELAP